MCVNKARLSHTSASGCHGPKCHTKVGILPKPSKCIFRLLSKSITHVKCI